MGALALAHPAPAQDQRDLPSTQQLQPAYGARVEMVRLHVAVFDREGNPATNLTAEDFVVIDNGVEHEVALALSPEVAPIDVALVFDQSDSIRESAPTVKRDARAFIDALRPEDCAFVLPFRHRLGPGQWGRPNDAALLETIDSAPLEGGTSFHDALIVGLSEVQSWMIPDSLAASVFAGEQVQRVESSRFSPDDLPFVVFESNGGCGPEIERPTGDLAQQRRKALVVLTDGRDTTSTYSYGDLLGYLAETDVPVFAVAMGEVGLSATVRATGSPAARTANARLRELAELTGGRYVRGAGSEDRLREAYAEIVKTLRASYLLGFYPESDHVAGAAGVEDVSSVHRHEIEVRVRRPGYDLINRAEYLSGDGDARYARVRARRGVELLRQRRFEEGLVEAQSAASADPSVADAHFLSGVALFLLRRHQEAETAVRRALELEPGVAASHHLAWQLYYELDDYEAAWEEAIRAHHAGADMTDEMALLEARSSPPPELALRMDVPRVFVEGTTERDPATRVRLAGVLRAIARGVSRSSNLGLVRTPQAAHYFLYLDADDPSTRRPRRLDADLELYNYADRRLWRHEVKADDVADPDQVSAAVDEALAALVEWLTQGLREN